MSRNDFDEGEITPAPVSVEDLSRPIVHVEPTLPGLANAILNLHAKLAALTVTASNIVRTISAWREASVTREECEANRRSCAAAMVLAEAAKVALQRKGHPTRESKETNVVKLVPVWWEWAGKWSSAMVSVLTLIAMIGGAWWWSARTVAEVKSGREHDREMLVRLLSEIKQEQRQFAAPPMPEPVPPPEPPAVKKRKGR